MENRAHAILAGLFVLILGAAATLAVWWFSGTAEATREIVLVSRNNITGLNLQAGVRFRGISAGRVESITIDPEDPRNILVRISVREDLPVTEGTTASLGYQGVTGLAFVQLEDRGTDPTPLTAPDGELPRIALSAGLVDELSDAAIRAMQQFKLISEQVSALFTDENVDRIKQALMRLESATRGVDDTFREAPATIAAAREFFSAENQRHLNSMLANLDKASGEAPLTMSELRKLLTQLKQVGKTVDETAVATGNGFLNGTLPRLNTLMKEVTVTSQRLTRLIEEVDASPQILLLGRGGQVPGPGEQGYVPPSAQ